MIPWYEAVRRAMEEPLPATTPAKQRMYGEALRQELSLLWSDLSSARSHAINRTWSRYDTSCNSSVMRTS